MFVPAACLNAGTTAEPCIGALFSVPGHLSQHCWTVGLNVCRSSYKLFFGSHFLHSNSTMQGVIALSSGESELYALVKGTSAGLGTVSMLKDLPSPSSSLLSSSVSQAAMKPVCLCRLTHFIITFGVDADVLEMLLFTLLLVLLAGVISVRQQSVTPCPISVFSLKSNQ